MKLVNYLFFLMDKYFLRHIPYYENRYEVYKYHLLEAFDPSPPKKDGEHDSDWYERIDIKYAIRHARVMYVQSSYLDELLTRNTGPEDLRDYPKKIKSEILELSRAMSINAYQTKQSYKELLDKRNL